MNTSLYLLAAEYQDAAEKLSEFDLDPQTIQDTLEGLSGALEVKAVNVAYFIRNIEATAESIKLAETEMVKRRKIIEARADRIRDYLKNCMLHAGIKKIESPYFNLAIRENPEAVVIDSEASIPSDYFVEQPPPPPKLDKTLIKKAIKDGYEVPGAHLERGIRLEIK